LNECDAGHGPSRNQAEKLEEKLAVKKKSLGLKLILSAIVSLWGQDD
jgi:hypothetical protein